MTTTGGDAEKAASRDCAGCARQQDLERARQRIAELEQQVRELSKLVELQKADLKRYSDLLESSRPNKPERAAPDQLQLAFERVLANAGDLAADVEASNDEDADEGAQRGTSKGRGRHRHGRRRLDLGTLPVEVVEIDPPEVEANGGDDFVRIGEEVSNRLAFRRGGYVVVKFVRGKWARRTTLRAVQDADEPSTDVVPEPPPVVVGELPESVWPQVMADPSAIAQVIVGKYDDVLPLHRQERIAERHGVDLPRSTQCGWLSAAYPLCERVVEAMFQQGRRTAHCIATDATSARVRTVGGTEKWQVFVFLADRDHVVFRHARDHNSANVRSWLDGFHGYLLADAASIYDALYREDGVTEVCCWSHCRRYVHRALETEPTEALEALSIIGRLFDVAAASSSIPMPERTAIRANRARPLLTILDDWVDKHRGRVDPGGKLVKAIGYYDNQRTALRRFLDDGRLRLDNNLSEQELRHAVLGRHAWQWFANERGLAWYATFRSLLASCRLHGLNAQDYMEQMLRLVPHWPVNRVIELAPKYWNATLASLDERQRAMIIPPWELARSSSPASASSLVA